MSVQDKFHTEDVLHAVNTTNAEKLMAQYSQKMRYTDTGVNVLNNDREKHTEYSITLSEGCSDVHYEPIKTIYSEDKKYMTMTFKNVFKYNKDVPRWPEKARGQTVKSYGVNVVKLDEEGKWEDCLSVTQYYWNDDAPDDAEEAFKI